MEVDLSRGPVEEFRADCLAVPVFEDEKMLKGEAAAVDRSLGGVISSLKSEGEIKGQVGETTLLHNAAGMAWGRVVVVGLGKKKDCDVDTIRSAAGNVIARARGFGAGHVASILPVVASRKLSVLMVSQAMAEGAVLAGYTFDRYKKEEKPPARRFTLVLTDRAKESLAKEGLKKGAILGRAQNLARDMANEPSSNMTPTILAERAKEIGGRFGLSVQVLTEKEAQKEGMGAFLGVAKGTDEPARFIVIRYRPSDRNFIALVGKGITFDSGGISIKPSENMDSMKGDMSGAAAVLGAMWAIAQLKPKIGVVGIVPATENMPSGHAMKPGDIVRAMNGLTIEVLNTDAEGRLALADAIAYARKLGAKTIIDVATLTGACVIALGEMTSALVSNDDTLANLLLRVSQETGEKMWRLPTFPEYDDQIKSDIADVKNSGGRPAGTITAGMFLKKFAGDARWAHIDIAGKEISKKAGGYQQKGMTGVGTRSLIETALRLARK
jgi:leucyl aminopeptidase